MMPSKVFIVDDHYMVIEGIHSLLQGEKNIEWMGHASNAASCMAFLRQNSPDVILMDINLPDQNGMDLCKLVKEKYPSVFVIGLSTYNQLSFIQKMMDNGASGYVLKNATQQELMEAIEAVVRGKIYFSGEASQTLQKRETAKVVLTRREIEVLELIAGGMTNNVIAQALFISPATVDTHRKNLLAKFEVKNTALLIRMAVQLEFIH
jgi:DNA-binding NarL/FixJ family response regulator